MNDATRDAPSGRGPSRRAVAITALVVIGVLLVVGLAAAWLLFFGSDVPDAPTLDDAVKVLLPSSSPGA